MRDALSEGKLCLEERRYVLQYELLKGLCSLVSISVFTSVSLIYDLRPTGCRRDWPCFELYIKISTVTSVPSD
jgi:hypothetical protein